MVECLPRSQAPPLARAIIAGPLNSHSHGKTGGEPGTFYHVSDVEGTG